MGRGGGRWAAAHWDPILMRSRDKYLMLIRRLYQNRHCECAASRLVYRAGWSHNVSQIAWLHHFVRLMSDYNQSRRCEMFVFFEKEHIQTRIDEDKLLINHSEEHPFIKDKMN